MAMMKHGPEANRKFRNAVRLARCHLPDGLPSGFFLTDPTRTPDPLQIVPRLPESIGVILRHFGQQEQIALAGPLAGLCREQTRCFLVAADPVTAHRVGADGVHWPARLAGTARKASHHFAINTMSAHSLEECRAAERLCMDGLILSPVFPSESPSAGQPLGIMRFSAYASACRVPVYGLGGIDHTNVERVASFGGFASVSGLAESVV